MSPAPRFPVFSILSLVAFLAVSGSPAAGGDRPGVTSDSFKYLDEDGQIRFAPSRKEVPEAYRAPLYWSTVAWCHEGLAFGTVEQSIELEDVDGDGQREVLVYFDDECPNKRRFAALEVIEDDGVGSFSILVTVRATRGNRPEPVDLDGDGRLEFVGFHHGDAPELWVWHNDEYVDLVRGGACYGSFWQLAMSAPRTPLEETYGRVLELYRKGECLRTWTPEPAPDPGR